MPVQSSLANSISAMQQISPEQHAIELGIPSSPRNKPAGNYVAAVRSGTLLFLSGKSPLPLNGVHPKGRLGQEFSVEDGYLLARSACIELLTAMRVALGSLNQVEQILEVHGSLNTLPNFQDHARVLDGASDLLVEVFGSAGVHARSVIGVSSLRNGVPLTVKAIIRCKSSLV
jgi:enamine deaminase RidA (YjgF/YER057c/UK114 family)